MFFHLFLTDLFQVYTHYWLKFAYEIHYYLKKVVDVCIKLKKKVKPPSILQKRIYVKYFDVKSYYD